ncbi:MAG: M56 family metallopeptidase [Thermoanaerobaculia bacterium]|nr:M56 family metallopeptidase [Thermoanaerobaculia bacterium]
MSTLLDLGVHSFWHHVAPLSVSVTVWVLVVAVMQRLLPKNTWPELRLALWLLIVVRLVVPLSVLPTLPFEGLPWTAPGSIDAVAPTTETTIVAIPGFLPPVAVPSAEIVGPAHERPPSDPATALPTIWHAEALAVVWLAGAIAFFGIQLAWTRRTLTRWRATGVHVTDGDLQDLLDIEARRMGLTRPPELVLTPDVVAPMVAGAIRPTIFLPAALPSRLSRELLAAVLLHELAHVRRRDTWFGLACLAVHATYWFHPAVWYCRRRVHALIEPCCDRTVARALRGDVASYRRALLHFARANLSTPGAVANRSFLEHSFLAPESLILLRLRLLENALDRPWRRRGATTIVLTLTTLASLPAAGAADRSVQQVQQTLVERPSGCLTLRYTVLRELAGATSGLPTTHQSDSRQPKESSP